MAACRSATENAVAAMLLLFTVPDTLGYVVPLMPLNDGGAFRVFTGGVAFTFASSIMGALSRGASQCQKNSQKNKPIFFLRTE